MNFVRKLSLTAFGIIVSTCTLIGQDTVRVMSYNLLQYFSSPDSRDPYFRTVVQAAKPDILVVEEIADATMVAEFLNTVLNYGGTNEYGAGDFIEVFNSASIGGSNELYYRRSKFTFVENKAIPTELRDINQFILRHSSGRSLIVYAVHLKAGSTSADSSQRSREVDNLVAVADTLKAGTDFIVTGDFNFYGDYEPAYQKLVNFTTGPFRDPIPMNGTWNNVSYKEFHTQATRLADGGLDDRFDLILISKAVQQSGGITIMNPFQYYKAFGNDGAHYNLDINNPPNTAVDSVTAAALYYASDHLPVMADFLFDPVVSVSDKRPMPIAYEISQNYPNPFNPTTSFELRVPSYGFVSVKVYNLLGRVAAELVEGERAPGVYRITWDASRMPSGVYFCRMTAGSFVETKKLVLMK